MTAKDKTRQKLMGSMRKTKSDAGIGDSSTETKPVESRPKEVAPPRQSAAPKSLKTTTAATAKGASGETNSYQGGRRVWPD